MEVVLDSNFIVSCLKRKIDFLTELKEMGFEIFLPKEVYQELKDLKYKVKKEDKDAIELALKLIDSKKIKKITLGDMSIDEGLIQKGKKGYFIATLDAAVKRTVKNKVYISDAKNAIVVERE